MVIKDARPSAQGDEGGRLGLIGPFTMLTVDLAAVDVTDGSLGQASTTRCPQSRKLRDGYGKYESYSDGMVPGSS